MWTQSMPAYHGLEFDFCFRYGKIITPSLLRKKLSNLSIGSHIREPSNGYPPRRSQDYALYDEKAGGLHGLFRRPAGGTDADPFRKLIDRVSRTYITIPSQSNSDVSEEFPYSHPRFVLETR